MKKILILLLLFGSFYSSNARQRSNVHLSGTIKFSNRAERMLDYSDRGSLKLPSRHHTVHIDSTGRFNYDFYLKVPGYFLLVGNLLYLSPGDTLTVYMERGKESQTIFGGNAAKVNNYLVSAPFPKAGSYLDAGRYLYLDVGNTLDHIKSAISSRIEQLNDIQGLDTNFLEVEKNRIYADGVNSLDKMIIYYMGNQYEMPYDSAYRHSNIRKDEQDSMRRAFFLQFTFPNSLQAQTMRDLVPRIANNQLLVSRPGFQRVKDYEEASKLYYALTRANERKVLDSLKIKIEELEHVPYRKELLANYDVLSAFGKGSLASDFEAIDTSGREVRLSDFKGKLIYLDFWATWCAPCIEMHPRLHALKKRYEGNPDIVFLSVSIDSDRDLGKWKDYLRAHSSPLKELRAPRDQLVDYQLTGVPRAVLIGSDFRILDMRAPLAKDEAITAYLDRCLSM